MLTVSDMTFCYTDQRVILDHINASFPEGTKTSILGPNGTGKSTLLNLLVARLSPQSGTILYDSKNVSDYSTRDFSKLISYIPQFHTPVFDFTVLDVVLMGRTAHLSYFESPGHEDIEIAKYYLQQMEIYHLKDKNYTKISGGERQLVLITSALCQEAKMIILDEPTSHLDFGNSYKFIDRLNTLNADRGIGIIMTTHFPDHALQLGDQSIILKEQSILASGKATEILTDDHLSSIYHVSIRRTTLFGKDICVIDDTKKTNRPF